MSVMNDINYFGITNHRYRKEKFGIREKDRFSHTYIIGKTGVGKTTLIKTKISQDIQNSKGFAVFDPHGDLAEAVVKMIPKSRKKDLVYFDLTDPNLTIGYNPLKRVSEEKRPLVASGLLEIFQKLYSSAWGVRIEHILRNSILTLLDQPQSNLADIHRLLNQQDFRDQCLKNITNEFVRDFWLNEFPSYTSSSITPVMNKLGAILSNPVIKRVLVDNKRDVSFRKLIDSRKIVVFNLAKGRIGDDASSLLGSIFMTSLGLASFSRQDIPEFMRRPFFIYADEFQNWTTSFLVNALSELRKYKIGLILANQYLDQIRKEIREAVLGNVGTVIVFRVGVSDARYFSKEFDGVFSYSDITHLPNYRFCIRLMIGGKSTGGFSANSV